MKTTFPLPRRFSALALLVWAACSVPVARATVFDFGDTPIIWSGGDVTVDVLTGAYSFGSGGLTTTRADFHYFRSDDQIVTYLSGSSLNFTTPSGPMFDEYSSNVGLGATVGPASRWGGPGSLYKHGNSQFASGIEGFLGFSIFDGGLGGTRYGYFSLTRNGAANSWAINGLEISDTVNTAITTRSLAVPDTGTTAALLACAFAGLLLTRRKFSTVTAA